MSGFVASVSSQNNFFDNARVRASHSWLETQKMPKVEGSAPTHTKHTFFSNFIQSDVFVRSRMMFKLIGRRCYCTSYQSITPHIKLSEPGTAGIITLNRPKDVNAITHEMSE